MFREIKTSHSSPSLNYKNKNIKFTNCQKETRVCLISAMKTLQKRARCSTFIHLQKLLLRPFQDYRERVIKNADPGASPKLLNWNQNLWGGFFFFLNKLTKWFLDTLNFASHSLWCWRDKQPSNPIEAANIFQLTLSDTSLSLHVSFLPPRSGDGVGGRLGGREVGQPGLFPLRRV